MTAGALLFGAGGSNLAITLHLMTAREPDDRPRRIVVVNRSPARLESMRTVHESMRSHSLSDWLWSWVRRLARSSTASLWSGSCIWFLT